MFITRWSMEMCSVRYVNDNIRGPIVASGYSQFHPHRGTTSVYKWKTPTITILFCTRVLSLRHCTTYYDSHQFKWLALRLALHNVAPTVIGELSSWINRTTILRNIVVYLMYRVKLISHNAIYECSRTNNMMQVLLLWTKMIQFG